VGEARPGERWRSVLSRAGVPWVRVPPPPYRRRRVADLPQGATGDRWAHNVFTNEVLRPLLGAGALSAGAWAVIALLVQLAGDQLEDVWPGRRWIARQLGWSTRTVDRRLAELRRLGVLEWAHRATHERGKVRTLTNLYRICVPEVVAERWRRAREQVAAVRARNARQGRPKGPHRSTPPADPTPASAERPVRGEGDDARSLVAGLYRSGMTVADIEVEVTEAFTARPAALAVALQELERIRAGP